MKCLFGNSNLIVKLRNMSASDMIAELPKLSLSERRRLAEAIFELEEEAIHLRDCDRRADENFRVLDLMEEDDAETRAR